MCTAAATGSEESKCKLVESTFPQAALSIISAEDVTNSATAALCTTLKALTFNDDMRPPASQCFMNARVLSLERGAMPVVLAAMQRATQEPEALHSIISALQQLCANDDICVRVRVVQQMPPLRRGVPMVIA
jgi:hypothetical protein